MKKLVREIVKMIIEVAIMMGVLFGVLAFVGWLVDFLIADMGRFWLGMFIMVSFLARALREELSK